MSRSTSRSSEALHKSKASTQRARRKPSFATITMAKLGCFLGVFCVKAFGMSELPRISQVQLLERNHLYPVSSVGVRVSVRVNKWRNRSGHAGTSEKIGR